MDFDIVNFFGTVNHVKLISILKGNVNDTVTLHIIKTFLRKEVLDNELIKSTSI